MVGCPLLRRCDALVFADRHDCQHYRSGVVQDLFADSVKGRVEFRSTGYRHAHDGEGRYWITMDGEEIAGLNYCRPHFHADQELGWVASLGVRRPWRKRGLGLALLRHSFHEFYRRGKRKVGLGVDAENLTGALRLYEKAGMRVHQTHDRYEKEIRPGREFSVQSLSE